MDGRRQGQAHSKSRTKLFELLECTLTCCHAFTLDLHGRFFVVLALTNFGKNACFFALLLESAHSAVEGFAFFQFDNWHIIHPLPLAFTATTLWSWSFAGKGLSRVSVGAQAGQGSFSKPYGSNE